MTTVSPALHNAFSLLRNDIYRHLDEAEYLAQFDSWTDTELDLVRDLVPSLCRVIRGLVLEHDSSENGKCRTCELAWPCPVIESVNALLKDPDQAFIAILEAVREGDR